MYQYGLPQTLVSEAGWRYGYCFVARHVGIARMPKARGQYVSKSVSMGSFIVSVTNGPLRTLATPNYRCGAARQSGPPSFAQHKDFMNDKVADFSDLRPMPSLVRISRRSLCGSAIWTSPGKPFDRYYVHQSALPSSWSKEGKPVSRSKRLYVVEDVEAGDHRTVGKNELLDGLVQVSLEVVVDRHLIAV